MAGTGNGQQSRVTSPLRPKVLALYIVLSIIWSTTWMVLKISLEGTPPVFGVGLRFAISSVILWIVFFQRKERLILTPSAIKAYLGFGVLNFAISYSLTYWGTQYIHSGLSAVLWATLPIFVSFLAHFTLPDDLLTRKKVMGGIAGLAGTFLIFSQREESLEDFRLIGVIAVFVAVVIAAWPNVFYKRHQEGIPSLHLNVAAQSIAVVILLPLSFLIEDPTEMVWNTANVSALLYLAVFGTVVTWSIYFWLFSQITVTQISAVALIPPVLATFLGWLFLQETFTARMMGGASLVLMGVFIVNMQQKRKTIRSRD